MIVLTITPRRGIINISTGVFFLKINLITNAVQIQTI